MLEIWNAENFGLYINNIRLRLFAELSIRKSLGSEFSLAEKAQRILTIVGLDGRLFLILDRLNKKANESVNKLLKAYIIRLYNRHFIANEIDYITHKFPADNKGDSHRSILTNQIDMSLLGYNNFLEASYYKQAYQSLCNALELIAIYRNRYNYDISVDDVQLIKIKASMEQTLDIGVYALIIPSLLEKAMPSTQSDQQAGMRFLKDLDDEQLKTIAGTVLSSFKLSEDRMENITKEMKAYRLFYNRCHDDSLDILQIYNDHKSKENAYIHPVQFVLRSKSTGIETKASDNMEELLILLGF